MSTAVNGRYLQIGPQQRASWRNTLEEALVRASSEAPPWAWFPHRVSSPMAAYGHLPGHWLNDAETHGALNHALANPESIRPRFVYIHIPFCPRRCAFCHFYRNPARETSFLETYADCLIRQVHRLAATPWGRSGPLDGAFLGGGTPTALPHTTLERIVTALWQTIGFASEYELTVETRAITTDTVLLRTLRNAGVNRVSLGVQSFDTDVRRGVGRFAVSARVKETIAILADTFPQATLDLIYNLPGHTPAIWQQDVSDMLASPATGASIYRLNLIPGTHLHDDVTQERVSLPGGADKEYQFFSIAHDMIASDARWRHMSSVHSGRIGVESNWYNATRAAKADIAAVGAGAAGKLGPLAYGLDPDADAYVRAICAEGSPGLSGFMHHPRANEARSMFALPEALSIQPSLMPKWFGQADELLDGLSRLGAVYLDNGIWRLTREGRFWSYNIGALCTEALSESMGQSLDD